VTNNNVVYLKTGTWKKYRDCLGQSLMISVENWKNDELDGNSITYHLDGKTVDSSINYIEGVRHGVSFTYWMSTGTIYYERYWDNGKLMSMKEYYETGIVHKDIKYITIDDDCMLHGISKHFYFDGSICIECTYSYNQLHGVYKEWYNSGILKEESNFDMGDAFGMSTLYDEDGEVVEMSYIGDSANTDDEILVEQNHPHPLYTDVEIDDDHILLCPVCMTNKSVIAGKCGHMICGNCSSNIYKSEKCNCPVCRDKWCDLRKIFI
jgi:antitoxin component YwqK of YwqJK toxin-antitoxin module